MRWTRGLVIGRGSSATVSLATTSTDETIAVKSSEFTSSTLLQKEQYLLSQLRSHYIVECMGCDITYENNMTMYNVLLEYMPGGSLADLVKINGSGELSESLIQVYMYQILKGLEYLHSNGIVHCDIKGQNILISKNNVKIADLGCAKIVGNSGKNTIFSGTPLFMAPEVARGEDQGFPADIWSMGCTFLEIATGYGGGSPWPELTDPVSALYKIGYSGDVPKVPVFLSDNAKDFLSKCFKIDANERWTAEELLNHPFFNGVMENLPVVVVQNSPTSILDHGFWSSIETCCSCSSEGPIQNVDSFSPNGRIKKLSLLSDSMLPNWTVNESWITVRDFVSDFQSGDQCNDDHVPLDKKDVTVYPYYRKMYDHSDTDCHTICYGGRSGMVDRLELELDSELLSLDSFYLEEVNYDRDELLFSEFRDDISINESLEYRISSLVACDNVVSDFEEMQEIIYYCNCCEL